MSHPSIPPVSSEKATVVHACSTPSPGAGPDTAQPTPLVAVEGIARYFDVSAPWLERLIYRQPKQLLRAVDGVSFSIQRGETLALVGESGCGKSTVARLLTGLYELSKGSIQFDGQDLRQMNQQQRRQTRRRVQMIFQDPYASLNPRWRVGRIIAEPLRTHSELSPSAQEARVSELLEQVGLTPADKHRYPHQFSGGQRQRISIARALALQPEFIVCDEPTSALDVSVQAQVLNLMKQLQRDLGLSYLFISHNLAVIHHMADRVGVMYLGRLIELADRDTLFNAPQHPYTQMLLNAIPDMTGSGKRRVQVAGEVPNPLNPPTGCAFHPRCPLANARCRSERPELQQLKGIAIACHAVSEERV